MERLFVGTYTDMSWSKGTPGAGASACVFDRERATVSPEYVIPDLINPSFIVYNSDKSRMYIINEVEPVDRARGFVSSYRLNAETGETAFLGKTSSYGPSPSHIVMDKDDRNAFLTNYCGECVVSIAAGEDGVLSALNEAVSFEGSGPDANRQDTSHPHSAIFDREYRRLVVCDLGTDKISVFNVDYGDGSPRMVFNSEISVTPGAGPRHCTFNAEGTILYITCEMGSRVCAFHYDKESGHLECLQEISTLDHVCEGNCCSHLVISKDGKYLYVGNRGDDSLAIFGIDRKSGLLNFIEDVPTDGQTPRHFAIDPTGDYLIAANQDSDELVIFSICHDTGHLICRNRVQINAPTFVSFVNG